jgi:hypothetical protein
MPCELQRQRGNAHGGQLTRKSVFDCACFAARELRRVEGTMKQLCLGIIVAIGLTLPAFGQGVDPLIGTWKLNNAKSTGSAYRSLTLTFTAAGGQNLVAVTDGVDNQGTQVHGTLRHTYDGMPHPTEGSPDADSTSYTRLEDTINIVRFKQGKVAEVSQSVIIPNKTYTNTGAAVSAASGQVNHFSCVRTAIRGELQCRASLSFAPSRAF